MTLSVEEKRRRAVERTKRWIEKNREKHRAYAKKWREANKEHLRAYWRKRYPKKKAVSAAWYARNKDYWRSSRLLKLYNITVEEFARLEVEQGGVCAICQKPETTKIRRLSIDHDHTTGRVRALLCGYCNKGIGHFKESPALLARAIEYLRKHGAERAA